MLAVFMGIDFTRDLWNDASESDTELNAVQLNVCNVRCESDKISALKKLFVGPSATRGSRSWIVSTVRNSAVGVEFTSIS